MNNLRDFVHKPPIMRLFRAVGIEEFYSIIKTNKFSIQTGGVHVKYFGVNSDETLYFANKIMNIDMVAVIEVGVLEDMIKIIGDFVNVDPFIFKSGTVEIQAEYLDEFNSAIQYIIQKY